MSSGTALSTGPVTSSTGRKPSVPAAASIVSRSSVRRLLPAGVRSSKMDRRISRMVASRSSAATLIPGHPAGRGLDGRAVQLHAGGEQSLDHHVMQVTRDALTILKHDQLLALL
jgi:hypothetical protein